MSQSSSIILATGQGLYQLFSKFSLVKQVLFSNWIILFQKYIIFGQNFKISLEAYLYYLQIKFEHKILLSSTYVMQFLQRRFT